MSLFMMMIESDGWQQTLIVITPNFYDNTHTTFRESNRGKSGMASNSDIHWLYAMLQWYARHIIVAF